MRDVDTLLAVIAGGTHRPVYVLSSRLYPIPAGRDDIAMFSARGSKTTWDGISLDGMYDASGCSMRPYVYMRELVVRLHATSSAVATLAPYVFLKEVLVSVRDLEQASVSLSPYIEVINAIHLVPDGDQASATFKPYVLME